MATAEHVVMMVANGIDNDSRVLKEAMAISRTGVRVTLLGVSPDGVLSMKCLDGNTVMARLPSAFPLRDDRRRRRARRRARRLPLLGYKSAVDAAAREARIAARLADLKAESGDAVGAKRAGSASPVGFRLGVLSRVVRQRWLGAASVGVRLRRDFMLRQNNVFAKSWAWYDGRVAKMERPVSWREVVPEAWDYEQIFGQVLDELAPDVLHAHDMHLVGVAARAKARAKLRGRDLKVVYDAHEYVPGLAQYGHRTPRWIAAWADHETKYLGAADRVITVSSAIAQRLKEENNLDHLPQIILNTPDIPREIELSQDIRTVTGLPAETPLLVYSGGITPVRGVETAVRAMPNMPDVHLAVVAVPSPDQPAVAVLRKLAIRLGVEDRMHYLSPVAPHEVTAFLSTADAGIIPMLRAPNHEMAMPNKLFEYSLGGLPVLVSDMASMKGFVAEFGIGESFEAGNPEDLAEKAKLLLSHTNKYRERLASPTFKQEAAWSGQADKLRVLYGELLGRELAVEPPPAPGRSRVLIGPTNTDGQAWAWARAVERHLPGIEGESLQVGGVADEFGVDRVAGSAEYKKSVGWRIEHADQMLENGVSHVLFESGHALLGQTALQWFTKDLEFLESSGIAHGVVFHSADVRDRRWEVTRERLAEYEGPRFVTAPDLVDSVEYSVWLPVVIDAVDPASSTPVLERETPVVLHLGMVDPVLTDLHDLGLIEYQTIEDRTRAELLALARTADIVVEDLRFGSYGVLAAEAMAAGRVVVGRISQRVRDRLPMEVPIVQADPGELRTVVERLIGDREAAQKTAAAGPIYIGEVHDGRRSAEALATFLGKA
ncbi:glycosyltransferase [Kribbella sp. NPDC051718]|uniref:glycosyltransferase n=1 Tax=Kribbella sp. NPDC051718 TaxID=3155168 RepID=UPI00341B5F34